MPSRNTDLLAAELRPLLARLIRKLRKLSPANEQLSQSERSVLVLLDQQDALLSAELAVMEKMTPQSMGQLLQHLSALGLITKTISPTDKRKILISLSATGKERIQKVRRERDEWLSRAIGEVCTKEEQAILRAAIGPLSRLVEYE
ncbi:MarR family winged helix-turn-helix transcriptional regulator [Chitinophaga arvensicola]|uniref:DNA-binding transcriptional regulator, MarR family n=1 Tax=Chitinophaga arvensicola TaxID=29529 RepID=A0A1I0S9Y6_9BACT|nr:MarR family transcriptional regulator [Chitinophaga arvensicola]SEW53038.1 DNA-binding transcriptional regulator, MarR family [Chitinophaga arvensicola]